MKIKLMSWNIGEDESNEGNIVTEKSYQYIKDIIEKENIDIACFQEAITSSNDMKPISEYLKENTLLKYNGEYEYSKSHINTNSMMGVVTCSRFPIKNSEILKYINPNLKYQKDENTLYVMHDKGFILTEFDEINLMIANGHGFPFFAFKRNTLDFMYVYEDMENKLLKKLSKNYIVCGDMNYTSFKDIYPNIYNQTNSNIHEYTFIRSNGEKQQLDYIMSSKNLKVNNSKVLNCKFDHRISIIEIDL